MICLDTNAVIAALNVGERRVRGRMERILADGVTIGIPAIVLYELWYGIKKSARPRENAAALAAFLALNMSIWPFELEDAEEAGDIRSSLERAGRSIGPYDVLIAAQARRRGAILVTANSREFERVPRLKVEDWQSGP
jgi:tRNA(fMet)-specific endonuclease VapC